jgi:hypothetical protein
VTLANAVNEEMETKYPLATIAYGAPLEEAAEATGNGIARLLIGCR